MLSPKIAKDCTNLGEIRAGIDSIDHQIVELLQQRLTYVKAAAQFKPNEESIPAPERVAAMLAERRVWAEEAGLSADYIESLFSSLIDWFIHQQILHWRIHHGQTREISR